MFYPRFAELYQSRDPRTVDALDHALAQLWQDGYRTIGYTYLARRLAIGEDLATDLLLQAAELGVVAPKFDLRCPHCGHIVGVSGVREVPVGDHECPNCWTAFTPTQHDLFVTFEVVSAPEGDIGRKKS